MVQQVNLTPGHRWSGSCQRLLGILGCRGMAPMPASLTRSSMNQERLRRGSLPVFSEFSGGFSLGDFPIQPPWVGGCGPAAAPVLPELVTGFVRGIRLKTALHHNLPIGPLFLRSGDRRSCATHILNLVQPPCETNGPPPHSLVVHPGRGHTSPPGLSRPACPLEWPLVGQPLAPWNVPHLSGWPDCRSSSGPGETDPICPDELG